MLSIIRFSMFFGAFFFAQSAAALAHASGRGFVLLLPTETMQISGTLAVAVSFVLLIFVPESALRRMFREGRLRPFPMPSIEIMVSLFSLVFWGALVVLGFIGARDPLANPLPLTVWTLVWVGMTLLCALLGNVWALMNPWTGLSRLLAPRKPLYVLPEWLGYGPALIGIMAFGWFEIVDLAPDDPARLARGVGLYWVMTFAAIWVFGERVWLERGEFLSVFFRFISRLAPLRLRRNRAGRVEAVLGLPGAGLVNGPVPSLSGALFILCALAIVSFDGLSETWWWLSQLGINVLEFPGRSAVVGSNTLGLVGACALLVGAFVLCLWLGLSLSGTPPILRTVIGPLALSIIPISLAYHFAHYLTALLVNGQYALATATDPLATGADWLALGQFYVTTSFLNTQESVALIWRVQSGAIIAGHIIAVCVAHRIALDLWQTPRGAVRGQTPLALLMIAYTTLGLWLLASPTA